MPPLIHLACAWLVALATGSLVSLTASNSWGWAVALFIGAGIVGYAGARGTSPASDGAVLNQQRSARRRTPLLFALATTAVAIAGWYHARTSREQDALCRQALTQALNRGDSLAVALDDRVSAVRTGKRSTSAATFSRGVARGEGALSRCRVDAALHVESGAADAGVWTIVRGHAVESTRGLRINARLSELSNPRRDWRRVARGRTGDVIDRDFGEHAPLVRALLIADQDGIPPAVRDTFADAGLVHMLSISGLHVAIIAGALLTLAGALRLSRSAAFAAALVIIAAYVAIIGAPPPAVRSAVMLAVVGLSERLQRPTHPWTALALGAVIPTAQADVVLDLGWQLSVGGMAALVAARSLWRRLRHDELRTMPRPLRLPVRKFRSLRGWKRELARELLTGTIATLVTAPLVAWTFGRISLIAPLSNLVAGPVVAFLQPVLFLAVVCAPWPWLSSAVATAAGPPIALLEVIARLSAAVPHAALHVAPTALSATCLALASAAVVRATASRSMARGLILASAAIATAVWTPLMVDGSGLVELHMIDVGQGDALALRTPRGRWLLVDAGRTWDGGDAGRRTIVPYVRKLGGEVAGFVLTHAHDDHVGGAASVVAALNPSRWWEPAFVTASRAYRDALATVQRERVAWHRVRPGDHWQIDGVDILVLAPDSAWTAQQTDANETSVVLRIRYGEVAFVLTGDAETEEEQWIVQHTDPSDLRADVLKLGHHGSKTSSSLPFLDAVQPSLALISVGEDNRYGHPSPETIRHVEARGIAIERTDEDQTIVVRTDGHRITVHDRRGSWTLSRGAAR